jgi:hypothetical protein
VTCRHAHAVFLGAQAQTTGFLPRLEVAITLPPFPKVWGYRSGPQGS